jgi:hypothetical protein
MGYFIATLTQHATLLTVVSRNTNRFLSATENDRLSGTGDTEFARHHRTNRWYISSLGTTPPSLLSASVRTTLVLTNRLIAVSLPLLFAGSSFSFFRLRGNDTG